MTTTLAIITAFKKFNLTPWLLSLLIGVGVLFVALEALSFTVLYPTLLFVEKGPEALQNDTSIISKAVIYVISMTGAPVNLFSLLALGLSLQIARQLFNYCKLLTTQYCIHAARRELQSRGTRAYLNADVSFYFKNNRAEVLAAISMFPSQTAPLVGFVADFVVCIVLVVTYVVCLSAISPWLALIAGSAAIPTILLVRFVIRKGNFIAKELSDETIQLSNRLYEDVQGIRLIKMRGAEDYALWRFQKFFKRLAVLNFNFDRARLSIEAYSHPILLILTVVTFYFAVTELGLGLASLGVFVLVFMRITPYFGQINLMRLEIGNALEKFSRYSKMLDAAVHDTTVQHGEIPFSSLKDKIEFDNVSFAYEIANGKTIALKNVSFEIRQGQAIAFVGRSGAGKSTLADMIPRFLEPNEGCIKFDGQPVTDFDLKTLRRGIAFVNQDPIFFDDTIRNNLTFGLKESLSDEEIKSILEASYCMDFISEMPNGLDTYLGDRGVRLSGGQRQRLSFARALATKPNILILDEPTSALDSESEAAIQSTLSKLHGSITIVVIAHRLATIRHADSIVVMEEGKVVGMGAHDILLAQNDVYKRLFEMQMSF